MARPRRLSHVIVYPAAMSNCFLCESHHATRGVLCELCSHLLLDTESIVPEQVACKPPLAPTDACLIDWLGRAHPLGHTSSIGREGTDILIYAVAVSRRHAAITRSALGWVVQDFDSHNGTTVNDVPVEGYTPIRAGDVVRIANVGFVFALGLPSQKGANLDVQTRPISQEISSGRTGTHIRLLEPTRGGGGLVEVGGQTTQVTLIQFALLRILIQRMRDDQDKPKAVSGFVPSIELLANLPWATKNPVDAHLKQVVRRLRKRLAHTQLSIEGRHGFGYRLGVERPD